MHYPQIFPCIISFFSCNYPMRYYSHLTDKKTENQKIISRLHGLKGHS